MQLSISIRIVNGIPPLAGGHDFMNNGEMVLDDRIMFHYVATGITPAMVTPKVGTGSAYAFTPHDAKGHYLDGGKTYKVTFPRRFQSITSGHSWSIPVNIAPCWRPIKN